MAKQLTVDQLLGSPRHILAWLRTKKPRAVVTKNIVDNNAYLFANFLKAKGHKSDNMWKLYGRHMMSPGWVQDVVNGFENDGPVTASQAIRAVKEATR